MAKRGQAENYDRKIALLKTREILRRWFPRSLNERPNDLADVLEAILKAEMPEFHVEVRIKRITTEP